MPTTTTINYPYYSIHGIYCIEYQNRGDSLLYKVTARNARCALYNFYEAINGNNSIHQYLHIEDFTRFEDIEDAIKFFNRLPISKEFTIKSIFTMGNLVYDSEKSESQYSPLNNCVDYAIGQYNQICSGI